MPKQASELINNDYDADLKTLIKVNGIKTLACQLKKKNEYIQISLKKKTNKQEENLPYYDLVAYSIRGIYIKQE